MHLAHHRTILRGTVPRVLLALLLCLAALGLTQCRLANDEITRVRVTPFARANDCLKECEREHHAAKKAEAQLHRQNKRLCRGDGKDDDDGDDNDDNEDDHGNPCLKAEHERHHAAVKAIKEAFKDCRNGCHHQGGGHGG